MSDSVVDISGLDKAEVLFALYSRSRPLGMGILQARNDATVEEFRGLIASGDNPDYPGQRGAHGGDPMYFDYLFGRPLKVDLSGNSFDPLGFDRDNGGPGSAQRVIDALRSRIAA